MGWVVYANRWRFARVFGFFACVGLLMFVAGRVLDLALLVWGCCILAGVGMLLLANSLVGLILVYGSPSRRYMERLLEMGEVRRLERVADLHIGTYRISYLLRDLLPGATIESVDI